MKHIFWPKRSLGQHFLIDRNILNKIIQTANLNKDEVVLEIGAGTGMLTAELCKKAAEVVAVEIDKRLVNILKENFQKEIESGRLKVIEDDILRLNLSAKLFISKPTKSFDFKVVANIPYQITALLLERLLAGKNKPKEIVLLVQKEVAQKISAKPPSMNRLALLVQYYGKPEIIGYVTKNCFRPKPAVDSAILKIGNIKPTKDRQKDELLFKLIKKGFSQKRKQLKNIFGEEILKNAGIMPNKRAEELAIRNWINICDEYIKKHKRSISV